MKKILCILLSLLLVLLNGCSSDTGNIRFGAARRWRYVLYVRQ